MSEFKTPFPKSNYSKKKTNKIKILLKVVIGAFALMGAVFALILVGVVTLIGSAGKMNMPLPKQSVLVINFDDYYGESRSDDLLTELAEVKQYSFYDLVQAIHSAANDSRVKAIAAQISSSPLGLAQIEELRQAVADFQKSGKKAYIFSAGMGNFGNGTGEYLLASAFGEIWMQPNTDIGITGVNIEVPFVRGLLDKIGVQPEFYARHEYKTAMTSVMREDFTPPYKEELKKLGTSVFENVVQNVAASRGVSEKLVKKLINEAPLAAEDALQNGLIDVLGYRADMEDKIKTDTDAELVPIDAYIAENREGSSSLPAVAYMVLEGVISEGTSSLPPMSSEAVIGADSVAEELEAMAKDENLKVLVLRINSPGGSYTASKQIWHDVLRLKEKKKIPVVISMGDYAASGGYFVAMAGDRLFADPLSLTGSIGVLGGKMVLSGLWQKLDVNWGEIKFGQNAGILSANRPFSDSEKAIFNKSLDKVYEDFTLTVSKARNISLAELDKLARGRVWTGVGAKEVGLVDEVGGISEALEAAKNMAEIKPGEPFRVAYYPRAKTLQQKLAEVVGGGTQIRTERLISEIGLDIQTINMLKRLQYNAVLPPFLFHY